VRGRVKWSGWLLGLAVSLALPGPARAEGPGALTAGTFEAGGAFGFSVSHNTHGRDLQTVYGYQGLFRLGGLLTDEHGDGLFKGNLELIVEPTYIHLDATPSADVGGSSLLGRWLFSGNNTVRPYFEAGGGVILGKTDIRQTRCDANFILEAGPGVLFFVNERTAVTVGYRFQHISNAGLCSNNLGINSSMGIVGVSYFFH
jgi:lipid A 3-O-deacylase